MDLAGPSSREDGTTCARGHVWVRVLVTERERERERERVSE